MTDWFIRILLGHLVGDYLLQSKKMAIRKSQKGLSGFFWCTIHSAIYTASVCLFLWTIDPLIVGVVFLSHWPIDRWSLATKWLKLIRGRDFIAALKSKQQSWEIDLSFSCIVYTIVDNTLHLIILWLAIGGMKLI